MEGYTHLIAQFCPQIRPFGGDASEPAITGRFGGRKPRFRLGIGLLSAPKVLLTNYLLWSDPVITFDKELRDFLFTDRPIAHK